MVDVDQLVADLARDEVLRLLRGAPDPSGIATGYLPGIDAHDIPSLSFVDGPQGIRAGESTAFPAPIALAASWDPELAREIGTALGREARGKDQDVLLAPALNLIRVPQCGRSFEYFSEDPLLTGDVAGAVTEGIQSAGVIATPKHYIANNQERDRISVGVDVSERALRELYLTGFRACVEAGAGAIMAAYNGVNGQPMTEHRHLLTEVIRGEWGFSGFVVSDWWATTDGVAAARAGLDVDMPGVTLLEFAASDRPAVRWLHRLGISERLPLDGLFERASRRLFGQTSLPAVFRPSEFDRPLREALASGEIEERLLRKKATRVLRSMAEIGMFGDDRPAGAVDTPEHRDLARRAAERGTVCLRNEGVLPLGSEDVAVIGPNADTAKVGGGGSSAVDPPVATSPLAGIRERAPGSVSFERGCDPIPEADFEEPSLFSDPSDLDATPERAVDAARRAGVAVLFVQDDATEGQDRESLALPGKQDRLVRAVADLSTPTVVVCNVSGPVEMPWIDAVDAVLVPWYPGQADGDAVARVLFGDADPGGRLPVTFGHDVDAYPATTTAQYPGVDGTVSYSEGVFVGYRHFDAADCEPLFPFGHGLSYAAFEYESIDLDDNRPPETAIVTVANAGDRSGSEVVQLYARPPRSVDCPPRTLVGSTAVTLEPGESRSIQVPIDRRALAYYDPETGWTVEPGEYEFVAGRSSRDGRLRVSVELTD